MSLRSSTKTKILLVGSGSGGHFFPLIALAESLNVLKPDIQLYFAGPDTYNEQALQDEHIRFIWVPAGKWRKYFSLLNFLDIFKTSFGFCVALLKLFIVYPDVVISKGGYASVPVILASWFLRIPIVVHESDATFGTANKIGSKFARFVITSYDEANPGNTPAERIYKLGIPIRKALLEPPTADALTMLNIDTERPVILVLGGSQGAERINDQIFASLDDLLHKYTVLHQTGEKNYEISVETVKELIPNDASRAHYHPIPFFDATLLNNAYHLASVVVSRAGSTAMYEIALHRKPAIIIPIPEHISHDQHKNAYANARTGGVVVIEEDNLKEGVLLSEIERIVHNPDIYESMVAGTAQFAQRDASEQIAKLILSISEGHV